MNPWRHLILTLPLLLSAGVTNPIPFAKEHDARGFEANRQYLVGKWRGESPLEGGGRRISLIHRLDDGTFLITFVAVCDGEPVTVQSEYGDWGLSGDIYFTQTRGHGSELPAAFERRQRTSYLDDAYRVEKLTPQEFQYASVSTGRSYRTRKMPDDYVLPEIPKVAAMREAPSQPSGPLLGEYVSDNSAAHDRLILHEGGEFEYVLANGGGVAPGTWEATFRFLVLEFLSVDERRHVTVLERFRRGGDLHLRVIQDGMGALRSSEYTARSVVDSGRRGDR